MRQSVDAIHIASRGLIDLSDRKDPARSDIAELRRLYPSIGDLPLDELACEVIQQALKRRAELKSTAQAQSLMPAAPEPFTD